MVAASTNGTRENSQQQQQQHHHHACNWIDSIASPIAILDRGRSVIGWNRYAADITKIDGQEIIQQPLRQFLQPGDADLLQNAIEEIEKGNRQSVCLNLAFSAKSNDRYQVKLAARFDDTGGSYCGIVLFFVEAISKPEPSSPVSIINGIKSMDSSERSLFSIGKNSVTRKLGRDSNTIYLPVFGVDKSGCLNAWNSTMELLTGHSKAEVEGINFVQQFIATSNHGGDQNTDNSRVDEIIQKALQDQETPNVPLDIQLENGATLNLVMNATTRRDGMNQISGVLFVSDDFLHEEDDPADKAKELRTLLDTANAPIFGIDCHGSINEWNLKCVDFLGYEKEQVAGHSLVDTIVVPSMRPAVEEILQNALQGKGTSSYKVDFQTTSNEVRHLLLNASTRRNAAGEIVGVVCVAQDVTEATHRDRAVGGMAAELRQLIDTANAPIFGIDVEGNINEWNKRTAKITGYSKEEAFDEPLVDRFIASVMKEKVEEILQKALQGNETSDYELEFISKSGEAVFLLVNATTRRDPENVIVGVVGVAQDVTEDKKHREALRQMEYLRASQEAKVETERNMTAYFAHELRNPLGAIDSALNAMPKDLGEEANSLVSGMQLCTGFMSSIMNNLLDVRKMEEGKMVLMKAPISLKKLISSVRKMLLPSVRPGVEFTKKSDTQGRDWIIGDSHRVQQVITNVVTNAIKYTVNGSICLSVGWEGDMVKFAVEDTGPGIPKNQQGKLFQRFVQRGGAPGTGLGLAIAKHLVDLNGGSIQFHSDPTVKAGTTCVIYMKLPICEEPKSIVEESSGVIDEPLSILIIDDIKMNRMMLKRRITKGIAPNAVIKEAATGEAALEICGNCSFDVIVVDQYMEEAGGVMVGTDAVFAMRRMRIDAVVIGCSGNDMGTQFSEAGADFVWQKPIPKNQQIIQDIRKSLGAKRPGFFKAQSVRQLVLPDA